MPEIIIGSPNQYMMAVNNSGAVPVAAYSGGTIYPLQVDSTGRLLTSATATVTTGSESYLFGISGGNWMPLAVQSGAEAILRTTASVSVDRVYIASGADIGSVYIKPNQYVNVIASGTFIPTSGEVSVTVESVFIASGADIGSVYLKDGAYVGVIPSGTFYSSIEASGTTGLPISGLVSVTGIATAGSLAIQTVDSTNLDIRDLTSASDSVEVKQGTQADLKGTVYQGTDPWIVLGSTNVNNFSDLGSTVVVDSPATIGSYTTQTVDGTVAISTSPLPVSGIVNTGSSIIDIFRDVDFVLNYNDNDVTSIVQTDGVQTKTTTLVYSGTVIVSGNTSIT